LSFPPLDLSLSLSDSLRSRLRDLSLSLLPLSRCLSLRSLSLSLSRRLLCLSRSPLRLRRRRSLSRELDRFLSLSLCDLSFTSPSFSLLSDLWKERRGNGVNFVVRKKSVKLLYLLPFKSLKKLVIDISDHQLAGANSDQTFL
jgi:hypothetical protein